MRIINLKGENFKRMVAFDITPQGNTVVVAGKNGQGKSSVLDAIAFAIEGKTGQTGKLTTRPVRDGAKSATVEITTEEFVITRKWIVSEDGKGYNDYLEITSKDGLKFPSPQTVLNKLIGDLSFDPLEFSRLKADKQKEELLGIVKLDINLDAWQETHDALYETRRQAGVKAKELRASVNSRPNLPDVPDKEVSVAALATQLQEANDYNNDLGKAIQKVKDAEFRMQDAKRIMEEAQKNLSTANDELNQFEDKNPVDTTAIQTRMQEAEQTNHNVRAKQDREKLEIEAAHWEGKHKEYDAGLEKLEKEKQDALAKAAFPIAGLGIDGDGVTFKNIPFSQCSAAEQLKISMAIAMAANPKLRVIRITDGSLLDAANMKVLEEMAEKNDFQIWIERVDDTGKVGIIIEDGHIVSPPSV